MLSYGSPLLLGLLLGLSPLAAAEWPQGLTVDAFVAAGMTSSLQKQPGTWS